MEYFDIVEQFHNYPLRFCEHGFHFVVIPLDLVKKMKEYEPLMRFTQLPFGWSLSTVFYLHMLDCAIEFSKRNPSNSTSAFQWCKVLKKYHKK